MCPTHARARGSRRFWHTTLALGVCLAVAGGADAATYTVTHLNDGGPGSLRQAIAQANYGSHPGADEIVFLPGLQGTIHLNSPLKVNESLHIRGPGASLITISGQALRRLFMFNRENYEPPANDVPPGQQTYRISGLTLSNGKTTATTFDGTPFAGVGAAIQAPGTVASSIDKMIIEDCHFLNNQANHAGAIFVNRGILEIRRTTFLSNHALFPLGGGDGSGGAVFAQGSTTTAERLLFTGNTAVNGGAFYAVGGTVDLSVATFRINRAFQGGAASFVDTAATVTNTAFLENTTSGTHGVAVAVVAAAVYESTMQTRLNLIHSTFALNRGDSGPWTVLMAGSNHQSAFANVFLLNNFFHNINANIRRDFSGRAFYHNLGGNLANNDPAAILTAANDRVTSSTGLVQPTMTVAGESPAYTFQVNAGPGLNLGTAGCPIAGVCVPAKDLRGLDRIQDGAPDSGVYELSNAFVTVFSGSPGFDTYVNDNSGDVNFGDTNIGVPRDRLFTVVNSGTTSLQLGTPSIPAAFSLASPFGMNPVPPGESTTFTIRFNAAAEGEASGRLSFTNNSFFNNPYDFTIRARVPPTDVAVRDVMSGTDLVDGLSAVNFGATPAAVPRSRTFLVRNIGGMPLSVGAISVPAGFTLTDDLGVTSIAPGGMADFTIRYDAVGSPGAAAAGGVSIVNGDADENPFNFNITARINVRPDARDDTLPVASGSDLNH